MGTYTNVALPLLSVISRDEMFERCIRSKRNQDILKKLCAMEKEEFDRRYVDIYLYVNVDFEKMVVCSDVNIAYQCADQKAIFPLFSVDGDEEEDTLRTLEYIRNYDKEISYENFSAVLEINYGCTHLLADDVTLDEECTHFDEACMSIFDTRSGVGLDLGPYRWEPRSHVPRKYNVFYLFSQDELRALMS